METVTKRLCTFLLERLEAHEALPFGRKDACTLETKEPVSNDKLAEHVQDFFATEGSLFELHKFDQELMAGEVNYKNKPLLVVAITNTTHFKNPIHRHIKILTVSTQPQ
jgi:hypothetical protein